jgi:ArsR family transcriptional regulator, lead/cadmium/zinc/bismuth-responsive transcriptional repressor
MNIQTYEDAMELGGIETKPEAEVHEAAICDSNVVHLERVLAARKAAFDPEILDRLGELYKVFADATRLRIIGALAVGELCVCDIGAVLGLSQSAVSHQLAVLRSSRLVAYRREGKTVFYRLADDHVVTLLRMGLEHAAERAAERAAPQAAPQAAR